MRHFVLPDDRKKFCLQIGHCGIGIVKGLDITEQEKTVFIKFKFSSNGSLFQGVFQSDTVCKLILLFHMFISSDKGLTKFER